MSTTNIIYASLDRLYGEKNAHDALRKECVLLSVSNYHKGVSAGLSLAIKEIDTVLTEIRKAKQ